MRQTLMLRPILLLTLFAMPVVTSSVPHAAPTLVEDGLTRRGSVGAVLRPAAAGRAGAEVVSIRKGSPAEKIGLVPGDRILRIGGILLNDDITQQTTLAALRGGRATTMEIRRADGSVTANTIVPDEVPRERVPGLEIQYASTVTDLGHRVRTIASRPEGMGGRLPGIFVVGWLSCDSVEAPSGPQDGFAELIRRVMTQSGAVVMRVDKPGVGDSEGPACADLDFAGELAAYRAAFRALAAHPWIDPEKLVLMGMSNGGGIAPLVPEGRPVAGYMVLGGWAKTWYEHMLFTLRVEEKLRGRTPAEISDRMRGHSELYSLYLLQQLTPGEAVRLRPHLASFWTGSGGHQYGRPSSFYHQLQALNLEREWSAVRAPTLAMVGTIAS